MRKKKVWRYYCDFCKKAGCSGGHLKKHESRCTLNPSRTCGFCGLRDEPQPDLKKAMKLLPDPEKYVVKIDEKYAHGFCYKGLDVAIKEALPKLRNFVGNCPACILAALRQKGIPVPIATDFDFKKECRAAWSDFNAAQRENDYF